MILIRSHCHCSRFKKLEIRKRKHRIRRNKQTKKDLFLFSHFYQSVSNSSFFWIYIDTQGIYLGIIRYIQVCRTLQECKFKSGVCSVENRFIISLLFSFCQYFKHGWSIWCVIPKCFGATNRRDVTRLDSRRLLV